MVSIIQIGREGSSIAMPILAKVMAPASYVERRKLGHGLY